MPVVVKICGLDRPQAVAAAVEGGARYLGFVFFPPSPRSIDPAYAARLTAAVPPHVLRVGLVVDADDPTIGSILAHVPVDMLQLHGGESPARVADIRQRFRRPVIKAIAVASEADLVGALAYEAAADCLLFDARPPADASRPGGNARSFEWRLLAGRHWHVPWLLAGGLDAGNVAAAVGASGAQAVDVSSGVEDAPGRKSVAKISAFLQAAARLERDSSAAR